MRHVALSFVFAAILSSACSTADKETLEIRINEKPPEGAFTLTKTSIDIPCADFEKALYRDDLGYVEMWGGVRHGFDEYRRLNPGEFLTWTEWMYPFHETKGLHFANRDFALAFFRDPEACVTVRICPAGELKGLELKIVSASQKKPLTRVTIDSAYPKAGLQEFKLKDAPEDRELMIIYEGEEAARLRPVRSTSGLGSNLHN